MPISVYGSPLEPLDRPTVVWKNLALSATAWDASGNVDEAPNVAGPQTFDSWSPGDTGADRYVEFTASGAADCAAILGHNLFGKMSGVITISRGGVTVATIATPTSNRDLAVIFPKTASTSADWRVSFTGTDANALISNVFIGERLIFERGMAPDYTPPRRSKDIELKTSVSLKGQFIANRGITMGVRGQANFNLHDWDWAQTDVVPFAEYFDNGGTFLWMGSPTDLPDDLTYARRDPGDPTFGMALSAGKSCRHANMSMSFNGYIGA